MMDVSASRRKPATYGKAGRKVLVHDLFDVATTQSPTRAEARSANLDKLNLAHAQTSSDDTSSNFKPAANSGESERFRRTGFKSQRDSGSNNATKTMTLRKTQSDTFDLHSSDEESTWSGQSALSHKRRRMAPKASAIQAATSLQPSKPKTNISMKPTSSRNNEVEATKSKKPAMARTEGTAREARDHMGSLSKPVPKPAVQKDTPEAVHKIALNKAKGSGFSSRVASQSSLSDHGTCCSPGQLSDQSIKSMASRRGTPKRKRNESAEIPSDMSSPSQLELRRLRLTPEKNNMVFGGSDRTDDSDSGISTPRKRRKRLIDRLDAPQIQEDRVDHSVPDTASGLEMVDQSQNGHSQMRNVTSVPAAENLPMAAPILQQTASSQSLTGASRPRATYSKQRSHLSDMVDEIDSMNGPGSQMSTSHAGSFPGAISQLELDDDSDEPGDTGPIKSIHELRQAGAVDRLDRDLELILEDIEVDNRSLRLQGLMQLIIKLEDRAFRQHVVNSGKLTHMITWVAEKHDSLCAWLVAVVLEMLASTQLQSTNNLTTSYKALQILAPTLIREKRRLAKVGADRKQNVSRAMVRDIVDFEQQLLTKPAFEAHQSGYLRLPLLAIQLLESTSRKLASLGASIPKVTNPLLDATLTLLETTAQQLDLGEESIERPLCISLLLQWLETSSTRSEDWASIITVQRCAVLGDALSKMMRWAGSRDSTILQSSLRLLVSISNNEARLCEAFGSSQVYETVFEVVDRGFDRLAKFNPQENEADKAELDCLILALGCSLNFAECDGRARVRLLEVDSQGRRKIDQLVDIFNSHVDEVAEIIKEEDSQILAPFGYLSMLLCTLCLERTILDHVALKIKDQSLKTLFDAVETFLSLMHFLETDPDDSNASGAFTARFLPILETVKQGGS